MTERRITTGEAACGLCGKRIRIFDPDTRTWIPDAPHDGKCPIRRANEKDAAA